MNVVVGNVFVLFGGDCVESFRDFMLDNVWDMYWVLL